MDPCGTNRQPAHPMLVGSLQGIFAGCPKGVLSIQDSRSEQSLRLDEKPWIPGFKQQKPRMRELAMGIEWQTLEELEFTLEYGLVDRVNTPAINKEGAF